MMGVMDSGQIICQHHRRTTTLRIAVVTETYPPKSTASRAPSAAWSMVCSSGDTRSSSYRPRQAPTRTADKRCRGMVSMSAHARVPDPALPEACRSASPGSDAAARVARATARCRAPSPKARWVVGASGRPQARHTGGLRLPHQLPRLQPALRLRIDLQPDRGLPARAAQPYPAHLCPHARMHRPPPCA